MMVLTQLLLKTLLRKSDYTSRIAKWGTMLGAYDHGFKNRNGQRTGKEADYRFYGPTGVGPMVKPMMS